MFVDKATPTTVPGSIFSNLLHPALQNIRLFKNHFVAVGMRMTSTSRQCKFFHFWAQKSTPQHDCVHRSNAQFHEQYEQCLPNGPHVGIFLPAQNVIICSWTKVNIFFAILDVHSMANNFLSKMENAVFKHMTCIAKGEQITIVITESQRIAQYCSSWVHHENVTAQMFMNIDKLSHQTFRFWHMRWSEKSSCLKNISLDGACKIKMHTQKNQTCFRWWSERNSILLTLETMGRKTFSFHTTTTIGVCRLPQKKKIKK